MFAASASLITMLRRSAYLTMFKSALLLLFVLTIPSAYSQALPTHRDDPGASTGALNGHHDDKQRRREELRAALKAQSEEASSAPTKPISAHDRAALREQLRLNGAAQHLVQP
jgi:hypothetical protein